MMTKEDEKKALEQIRKIIEKAGADSYIGIAFKGDPAFKIAETNIDMDMACSVGDRIRTTDEELRAAKGKIEELECKAEEDKATIKNLEDVLEEEQEWGPKKIDSQMSQSKYEDLKHYCGRPLMDEDTMGLIESFGFRSDRVKIEREIDITQTNRHGETRRIDDKVKREPMYNATDWNYVRFSCGGYIYEIVDGELYKL